MWKIKCPYCRTGYVGPLMGGLRDDYYGRRRLCRSCGTIWRMSMRGYQIMIGSVLFVFCLGIGALYYHHWLQPQALADSLVAAWLLLWLVFLWPLVYRTVWRIRVKKP